MCVVNFYKQDISITNLRYYGSTGIYAMQTLLTYKLRNNKNLVQIILKLADFQSR